LRSVAPPIVQAPPPTPASTPQPQAEVLDTSNWQTYRNDEFGFEVKYPGDWEARTTSRRDVQYIDFASAGVIRFDKIEWYPDARDETPYGYYYIEILVERNSREESPTKEWYKTIWMPAHGIPISELTKVKETYFHGLRALRLLDRYILFEKDGHIFVIHGGENGIIVDNAYTAYVQVFEQILATFRFVEE